MFKFLESFGGHKLFFGTTDTPVLDFWRCRHMHLQTLVGIELEKQYMSEVLPTEPLQCGIANLD